MQSLYTIGHSNRDTATLIGLLQAAGVTRLVDVRSRPASRRHPHFNRAPLADALARAGIEYLWLGRALGGLRRKPEASRHTALTGDAAANAYAVHMEGPVFRTALAELEASARTAATALMCAEREPMSCHRRFIADALTARGRTVRHLVDDAAGRPHALDPRARRDGATLVYDRDPGGQMGLF